MGDADKLRKLAQSVFANLFGGAKCGQAVACSERPGRSERGCANIGLATAKKNRRSKGALVAVFRARRQIRTNQFFCDNRMHSFSPFTKTKIRNALLL